MLVGRTLVGSQGNGWLPDGGSTSSSTKAMSKLVRLKMTALMYRIVFIARTVYGGAGSHVASVPAYLVSSAVSGELG